MGTDEKKFLANFTAHKVKNHLHTAKIKKNLENHVVYEIPF